MESVVRRPPFGTNPLVGERGSDTQRRILGAALEVFGKVGFAEARVELITAQAGCSRPAFYQYFSSKDDVFWALASRLAAEMVHLTRDLEKVTPDEDGVAHLTEWVGRFMDLHEDWAPVFASFQAATRDHEPQARDAATVGAATAEALLRAFGLRVDARNRRLASTVVSAVIRVSFYAEQAPGGTDRLPLVKGVARALHRIFAGPIEGVNVLRSGPSGRRAIAVALPDPAPGARPIGARGEQTRQRLLETGAKVLPARGYHDARVDDIVATAGVSHGTFYRYFANKDDYFRALAEAASARMMDLIDRLPLDAEVPAGELRAWTSHWFDAYETDGGVISTWQEMLTSPELASFSKQVAASVFQRLVRLLEQRDFGVAVIDAVLLLAILERSPYSVYTLGFMTRDEAIESMVTVLRRGLLALPD